MSTLESDYGDNTTGSMYGSYCFIPDNECSKGSSPNCGSGRETKWWLNDQGRRWGYFQDQLNMLDSEVKILGDNFANRNVKGSRVNQLIEEFYSAYPTTDPALSSDVQLKKWHFKCKGNEAGAFQEFQPASNDNILLDAHLRESESCNSLDFEQQKKHTPDLDSHWIGLKKFEPWWHAGDKEVSATLVSETSSHRMRNYDHTSIRFRHVQRDSDNCVNCFDQFKQQMTNKEAKLPYVADTMRANLSSVDETEISYLADCSSETLASISTSESLGKQGLTECILQASNGSFRSDSLNAVKAYPSRPSQSSSEELSRAQLLEALCHSQTRAREAEKFAQKACDEKDHIINLFFQQASYLFAYRQWLRVLQLEMLCLHLRRRDELSSCANAVVSPWLQHSSTTQRKNRKTTKKNKPLEECRFCQYAIFFAVGLTLAGAGFLVGWTIGWLLPAFWTG